MLTKKYNLILDLQQDFTYEPKAKQLKLNGEMVSDGKLAIRYDLSVTNAIHMHQAKTSIKSQQH